MNTNSRHIASLFSVSIVMGGLSLCSQAAWASPESRVDQAPIDGYLLSSLPASQRIVGGQLSKTCHFPNAVQIKNRGRMHCTGTLVHPEIVTTAKHCLGGSLQATFGEKGQHKAITMQCKGYTGGGDMAYCKLSEPVNDVPIVPMLMGCELEALQKGVDIALVGFGNSYNNAGDGGVKREVITPIHAAIGEGGVGGSEILLGHREKGSCNGDSGGPAYIDLRTVEAFKDKPGAGWRSFGITSRKGPGGGNCASTTVYGVTAKIAEWIEMDSGIDVTPCFDADGTWNPGPECKDFPDPQAGGAWPNCDTGDKTAPSQTCGDNGEGGGDDDDDKDGNSSEDDKDDDSGKDDDSSGDEDDNDDKDDSSEDDSEGSESGDDPSEDEENNKTEDDEETPSSSDEDESTNEDDDEGDKDDESSEEDEDSNGAADDGGKKSRGCQLGDGGALSWMSLTLIGLPWLRRRKRQMPLTKDPIL